MGGVERQVLIYVLPEQDIRRVMAAMVETCKQMFGPQQNRDHFDLVVRIAADTAIAAGGRVIGMEVEGRREDVFDTCELIIKHPMSMMWPLPQLESMWLVELNRAFMRQN